jgi:uroporphyrinogen decarboxylase
MRIVATFMGGCCVLDHKYVQVARASSMMRHALCHQNSQRPVWSAVRSLQVYQELCKTHTTFRERSENVDVSVEVTLQPFHAFQPDGVVLFSDILTPLTGMNIPFDIVKGKGPIIEKPVATMEDVAEITTLDAADATPFVGQALRRVKDAVGNKAAVLGFAGAPFTLACYIVEGASSKNYSVLKHMAFSNPEVLFALLDKLTENITDYCRYQANNGAEVLPLLTTALLCTGEHSATTACVSPLYRVIGCTS